MAAVYDPSSGLYVDSTSGAVSLDPYGTQVVTDPSLVNQARRNLAVSHGLLSQLAGYGAQFTNAVGGEQELARHLSDVIAGRAPSVANAQLQQGLGQIRQQADSQASGATGQNAALARMEAIRAGGDAATSTNQTAALVRAQEEAQAAQNEGAVLGNVANQATGMYGANLTGATNFSGQAGNEAAQQAQIDEQRREANLRLITNLIAAGGAAGATIATGGAAAPALGAAASGVAAGQAGNAAANSAGINGTVPNPTAAPASEQLDSTLSAALPATPSDFSADAILGPRTATYEGPDINNGTGLSTSQAYTSDRREKTDVHRAPMDDFLDKLAGFTFAYKAPGTPGEAPGQRISPMAQDVRRSAIGKTMVIDGKPLQMDIPNALGGALAGLSYLNEQIKQLKAGRAGA